MRSGQFLVNLTKPHNLQKASAQCDELMTRLSTEIVDNLHKKDFPLALGLFVDCQDSVDAGLSDVQLAGNLSFCYAIGREGNDFLAQFSGQGFSAFILARCFRFGDTLPLPLQHDFPLELSNTTQDDEHQLASRRLRIHAQVKNAQACLLFFQRLNNSHEVRHGPG